MRSRVLVVDDEPSIRLALQLALEDGGLEVETAGTAELGLRVHEEHPCDLLLLDKDLPGMSGIDLIRKLRSRGDLTPVIVITGHASVESAIHALNLGIEAYVDKPFDDIHKVVSMVRSALRKKRGQSGVGLARVWRALTGGRGHGPLAVLVAASDPDMRAFIVGALAHAEAQVAETGDADDALVLTQRATPDVVILDGSLDSDISDLVNDVLARAPRAACVVVNASLQLAAVERLTSLGTRAVLSGRPGSEDLQRALVRIVEQVTDERLA